MKTTATDKLAVELWPTEKPIPYARNARVCPEEAIAKVAASIKEFGFRQPIVVDEDGVIIAGHTRLLAAKRLDLEQVPVHVAAGLTPEQAKAYRIMDNRSSQETSWDLGLLPLELSELLAAEVDLSRTGFESDELAELLASLTRTTDGLTDEDEVPEVPEEPVTKPGDLYLLGEHRLLCGDSTRDEDVQRVMDGRRAALMMTDPPYLVDYDGGEHPATEANGGKRGEATSKRWDAYIDHEHSVAFYVDFLRCALEHALTGDAAVYQCYGIMRSEVVWEAWRKVGFLAHQVLVWKKTRSVLTYSHYMWDYEPIMYGWREGHMPKRKPPADARAVWEVGSAIEDAPGSVHPTMKPVELVRRPILYHTKPGEVIYEPFSGSGTAIIAAESEGRACHAIEQSPAFCDVAVARWERFTGREATKEGGADA